MNKTVKKVWNIVSGVIVAIIVVAAILLVGVRLIGLQVFTVLSGSMEPEYPTGSLIYVKPIKSEEARKNLQPGDVITFMLSGDTVATHRIVAPVPDEEDPSIIRYRTKGDANDAEDGTMVHYMNIIGKPIFKIPYLGYVSSYIQNPPGTYVAISAGAILILIVFLPDLLGPDEKKKKAAETAELAEADKEGEEAAEAAELAAEEKPDEGEGEE